MTTGTTRMMAAAECRNRPISRKKTLSSARIAQLSSVTVRMAAASWLGMRISVR
jgi:hypothetical protein